MEDLPPLEHCARGQAPHRPQPLPQHGWRYLVAAASAAAICLRPETTNRRNLLYTACPRTYETLEPEADMSWGVFTRIVDQTSNMARLVLHGIGETMLIEELPRIA